MVGAESGQTGGGQMNVSVALRHQFDGFDLDVEFESGAGVTAIFGASGAGKSTILNAISGTLRPDWGQVQLDGRALLDTEAGVDVPLHRRRVARVFQQSRLFPHMTVRQNLVYGGDDPERFDSIVQLLGLDALLARKPATLSGGEQQRVAIGRAVLAGSELLLMDEPLSSLDAARKAEIIPYFRKIQRETNLPVVYVSHDLSEVKALAHRVVLLREGRVHHAGDLIDVFANPALVRMLGHGGAGAFITARVVCHHPDGLSELEASSGRLLLPQVDGVLGSDVTLQINVSDVIISMEPPQGLSALNVLPAVISDVHMGEGPGAIVSLRCGSDVVLARVTKRSFSDLGMAVGQTCHAVIKSMAIAQGRG